VVETAGGGDEFGGFGMAGESEPPSDDPFGHLESTELTPPSQLGLNMESKAESIGTTAVNVVEKAEDCNNDDFGAAAAAEPTAKSEVTSVPQLGDPDPFGQGTTELVDPLSLGAAAPTTADPVPFETVDDKSDFGAAPVNLGEATNATSAFSNAAVGTNDFEDFGGSSDVAISGGGKRQQSAVEPVDGLSDNGDDDEFFASQDKDLAAYGISMGDHNDSGDFGDFGAANVEGNHKTESIGHTAEELPLDKSQGDDNFGDFGSAAISTDVGVESSAGMTTKNSDRHNFEDFGSAGLSDLGKTTEDPSTKLPFNAEDDGFGDDDFGDFGSATMAADSVPQQTERVQSQLSQAPVNNEEEDFGDFGSAGASGGDGSHSHVPKAPINSGGDDDFGDFGSANAGEGAVVPSTTESLRAGDKVSKEKESSEDDDFGEFGSAAIRDGGANKSANPTMPGAAHEQDGADDFGSFGSALESQVTSTVEKEYTGASAQPIIENNRLLVQTRLSFEKLFGEFLTPLTNEEGASDDDQGKTLVSIGEFLERLEDEASPRQLSNRTSLDELLRDIKRPTRSKQKMLLASERDPRPFFYPTGGFAVQEQIPSMGGNFDRPGQNVPKVLDVKLLSVDEAAPDMASPDVSPRHVVESPAANEFTGTVVAMPPLSDK